MGYFQNINFAIIKIINSSFKMSYSLNYGGVFYFDNGGNILIMNCFFEKNNAPKGGAIFFNFDENIG